MFSSASRIIVLGSVWHNFIVDILPDLRKNVVILPNATRVAKPQYRSDKDIIKILFLGRIGKNKGTPQLIEALKNIDSIFSWHAILAGDGDIESTKSLVVEYGLEKRISLPGWVGADEVETLLADADILTLPSFSENLPMSVIEGMAAGLAIVATPVGAVEDIITDGETGLLVPPGDVKALADALRRLIEDAALRHKLGKAAASFHRSHLDIDVYASTLAALWRESCR